MTSTASSLTITSSSLAASDTDSLAASDTETLSIASASSAALTDKIADILEMTAISNADSKTVRSVLCRLFFFIRVILSKNKN